MIAAICGLGMTEIGKVYRRTPTDFAAEAVRRACDDAGLPHGAPYPSGTNTGLITVPAMQSCSA
jgi:acetyl-CoA acetyltransferase